MKNRSRRKLEKSHAAGTGAGADIAAVLPGTVKKS